MIVDYDCDSKEIIDFKKSRDDFEQGKKVLSYMRCLRHPNIVELLGSFTFKDKHYLLFPPAEQDLEQLMSFSRAPARFDSDEAYLLALQGLGSAVNHMHTYTSNVLDIAMIGCYYDLKPKNILVLEDGFILAGFGHRFAIQAQIIRSCFQSTAAGTIDNQKNVNDSSKQRPFLFAVRTANDSLEAILPVVELRKVHARLEHHILDEGDPKKLTNIGQTAFDPSLYPGVGKLAAVKRMIELSRGDLVTEPRAVQFSIDAVHVTTELGFHHIGQLTLESTGQKLPVLIERIEYEAHWSNEGIGKIMFDMIGIIGELHDTTAEHPSLKTLRCRGYYHDQSKQAFGLLFELPLSAAMVEDVSRIFSLADVIEKTYRIRLKYPLLGDRFELAFNIVSALMELHKAGWLHKNIATSNLIFCGRTIDDLSMDALYVTGFNYSRPNDKMIFSDGPRTRGRDWSLRQEYQRPDYRRRGVGYISQYDYYSIGMMLLEIGLWQNITQKLLKKTTLGPDEKQDYALNEHVPFIGSYMGARYTDAVQYCLGYKGISAGIFESLTFLESHKSLQIAFDERVV
ncbi:hypothetical protein OEA41_009027 [Lepraria neglecta]|uniref:Protein kinase domain-containing protein n=1 Tax=Lepraria neglecta TaxID=209136 RepID=A0AAD9Z541_9LECA|nr:hypothetical protein OEA41_009027 [Lepraria neglecta]